MNAIAEELNARFQKTGPEKVLEYFLNEYQENAVLGSSLGAEDQVLTDMIVKIDKNARIFTLDTGRMFPETYKVLEETNRKYGINIEVYFPNSERVEEMVRERGINLFYQSVENRKLCCHIRKVEPSQRALRGAEIWFTGIRKDQTISRFYNKMVEYDKDYGLMKVNPLLNWTEKQVWEYIRKNDLPYNELHDKGFPSIGCQPCTRSVQPGEDARAGRWWWEQAEHKECGLHVEEKKK